MSQGRLQNVFMDRWILEPKTQRVWGVPHATWFTLMALGGGLFLLGRLLGADQTQAMILGVPWLDVFAFVTIAVGGLILISDLGRPLRFWRAFLNVRTSWIAWGAWSDLVFLAAGSLLVLPSVRIGDLQPFDGLPWDAAADTSAGRALETVAGVAAVVVMFYAGAVLARPRAIPFWHSPAIPLQFMLSGFAMAASVLLVLDLASGVDVSVSHLWALVVSGVAVLSVAGYHLSTGTDMPGKSHSLERLRGEHRIGFVWGALVGGHALPVVAGLVGALAHEGAREVAAVVSLLTIPGGFLLRLLTLRVGIFPPVRDVRQPLGSSSARPRLEEPEPVAAAR